MSTLAFTTPGFAEIIFLLVLGLLIFGPERLPGMARSAGRALNRFKAEASSTLDDLKGSVEVEELRRTTGLDDVRDEVRGVADDLRQAPEDLKRRAALPGADAGSSAAGGLPDAANPSGAGDGDAADPSGVAGERERVVPFDPDAT